MPIEVEQKFPVADLGAVAARLAALGAELGQPRVEEDRYYRHPARDFAETDEALRLRRVGPARWITYKGPKLDATTKTRREIELPLPAESAGSETSETWENLLEALGFTPVAVVRKKRRKARLSLGDCPIEVSLDEVEQVGTFVELEVMTDAGQVESAKVLLAALATQLGLDGGERRSYLELLLERRRP
jgi:adenylate cyclase class 2